MLVLGKGSVWREKVIVKEISVIGCCVCRDLFEADTESFSFHTDIRFSSPISMLSQPVDFMQADFSHFTEDVKTVGGKWYKKNLINDINKTAFTALEQRHGEYLVLDFEEARISLANIKWPGTPHSLLVSNSVSFRAHYQASLKYNVLNGTQIDVISPLDYDDGFWKRTIEAFAKKITGIFAEEKIILIKTQQARMYRDTQGLLHPYYSKDHFGSIMVTEILMEKLYGYFVEACPRCKIIEIPPYAIGSQTHKWGNHPLHFTDIFYEYLLTCVKAIVLEENYDVLGQLYDKYGEKFKEEYEIAQCRTALACSKKSEPFSVADLLGNYEEYNRLGRKQKALILFALDKKTFIKNFKHMLKNW